MEFLLSNLAPFLIGVIVIGKRVFNFLKYSFEVNNAFFYSMNQMAFSTNIFVQLF